MIQLMSRAGNFSCARAEEGNCPTLAPAAAPSAAAPALPKKPRRSIRSLLMSPSSLLSLAGPGCARSSACLGQPHPQALVERSSIQEVCQRDILRYQAGGVDQNPLVIALPAFLLARNQLVDLALKIVARELSRLDHVLELPLQHVEVPAVDDDLVH